MEGKEVVRAGFMYRKVEAYVKEHHMLTKQDKVIAGVSGGADSICLLFMLLELQKETGFEIVAVHVNHGLRGEAADEDEAYVQKICQEQEVPLVVFRENVKEHAKKYGLTEEEAGREVRRKCFLKVKEEKNATKIALAHHKNDNVETFLWNLCRGTRLKGLGGILPVAGTFIRPLLCLSRKEIEDYLEKNGISYCMDETNLENNYTRNRIRNQILPALEDQVNAQSVSHMADVIENMRLLNEYVEAEVGRFKEACISKEQGGYILNKKEFENIPEVFRKNVIHELLGEAAGKKKDIESVHIKMVEELLGKQVGRKCDLPYELEAFRVYEGILLKKKKAELVEEEMPDVQIRMFPKTPEMVTFPEKAYTKWFDYDIIKRTVKIRHRELGDYIVIDKSGKTQKLKQYFINEKIPQSERDKIWLVADGQQIMWIVGYRQNKAYQITDQTVTIMEISFEGK